LGVTLHGRAWSEAATAGDTELLVSTVPAGVADELATAAWKPELTVFDALYHPWPTPLAAAASAAGCRVVGGLELLLAQAVRQFELFTGVPAPVPAMRDALHAAAARR
ncbi:MAG: shikimate dehydrogenase, partial [Micromonosporaceae bacterium]